MNDKWLAVKFDWDMEILVPPEKQAGFMEILRKCTVAQSRYMPGKNNYVKAWVEPRHDPDLRFVSKPERVMAKEAYDDLAEAVKQKELEDADEAREEDEANA